MPFSGMRNCKETTSKRALLGLIGALFLFCFVGCSSKHKIIIAVDPYIAETIQEIVDDFSLDYPEIETELLVRESTLLGQHIKMGHPVDIFIPGRPDLPELQGIGKWMGQGVPIASDQLVLVVCQGEKNQSDFGSDSCLVIAADDTPLRMLSDEWMASSDFSAKNMCTVVGNFHAQMRDYLSRGWVKGGVVYNSLAMSISDVHIVQRGPLLKDVFTAFPLTKSKEPAAVQKFLLYLKTEKSTTLLARKNYIP